MDGEGSLRDSVADEDAIERIRHFNAKCAVCYGVCCNVSIIGPVEVDATRCIVDERVVENSVAFGVT